MQFYRSIRFRCWLVIVCFCDLAGLPMHAQTVRHIPTSVEFDQSQQRLLLHYDLERINFKKTVEITPYWVTTNGDTIRMRNIFGDFGLQEKGGKNKLISWDLFKDGVDSLVGLRFGLFHLTMDAVHRRYFALLLQGSNSAPLGFKVMQLSRFGFYAGARIGKLPPTYQYTVTDAGVIDFQGSGVYAITDKKRLAGYTFSAGQILQINRNLYGYVGLGYGTEQLYWEYQEYNLDREPVNKYWALNESINRKGFVLEGGWVVHLGPVLLDFGISSIKFQSVQLVGGAGIILSNR